MEIVKDEMVQETSGKITYDPNKKYVWTPQDQFVFSGSEFGMLLNVLRAMLSTPEAGKILAANQANNVLESILAKYVEQGVVKEAVEEVEV